MMNGRSRGWQRVWLSYSWRNDRLGSFNETRVNLIRRCCHVECPSEHMTWRMQVSQACHQAPPKASPGCRGVSPAAKPYPVRLFVESVGIFVGPQKYTNKNTNNSLEICDTS